MADTIRERIISAYLTRLADWTVATGFSTGCGAQVFRAVSNVDPDALPAVVLIPRSEAVTHRYGMNVCEMVLRIEALAQFGATHPGLVQERMLGDAIKIMMAPPFVTLSFAAAGYTPAVAGDIGKTVIGATSEHTGTLLSYNNTARHWIIQPDTASDTFDEGPESVTVTAGPGAGTLSRSGIRTPVTDLITGIRYTSGGPASVSGDEHTITAVFAEFTVTYTTLSDDPYSQ